MQLMEVMGGEGHNFRLYLERIHVCDNYQYLAHDFISLVMRGSEESGIENRLTLGAGIATIHIHVYGGVNDEGVRGGQARVVCVVEWHSWGIGSMERICECMTQGSNGEIGRVVRVLKSKYEDWGDGKGVVKLNDGGMKRPMLYDGSVIAKETNVISIADFEETLMLEKESRSKMLLIQSDPMVLEKKVNIKPINYAELNRLSEDFGKRFIPQQELFDEQAFWLQISHPNTDQSASSPVNIEVPRELPKVEFQRITLTGFRSCASRSQTRASRVA
ncbi:hypothetical protein Tco_0033574 [Tanacetum coccineum]